MPIKIVTPKWILYRHTNDFATIVRVAQLLKNMTKGSVTETHKKDILLQLKKEGSYGERNPELPLDAINHKINTLYNFMFGYKDMIGDENRFLFSPLGNLFLKNVDNPMELTKIFFTMLWAVQFEHPSFPTGTRPPFHIYPYRLLFKLLTDQRLGKKFYSHEEAYLLVFVECLESEDEYDRLVTKILEMRNWSNQKIKDSFMENEHVYVNAFYEWNYQSKLFESAGIIEIHNGEEIARFIHGKDTTRILRRNSFQLTPDAHDYCIKLMKEHPYDQIPPKLGDKGRMRLDIVKQIYNFFPKVLLAEINETGEELDKVCALLELPKKLEEYSNNKDNAQAYLFEDKLEEAFNMFVNIRAKKIGGPENVDVECLYTGIDEGKFGVDGKSRKDKLAELNPTRLKRHRDKIDARYTIVVPPRFMPGALEDIRGTDNVILTSDTFSEFLYNCIVNNVKDVDYADFEKIIQENMGGDISPDISALTMKKFGVSAQPKM